MLVIPAIDIRNGRCVRLQQGRANAETIFGDDPAAMAQRWVAEGAALIHVVDLDGAFEKRPRNMDVIKRILAAINVPIQVGGGIRDMATIEAYLTAGVKRVIIGTKAVEDPQLIERAAEEFPNRIVLGVDARKGYVATEGWTTTTEMSASKLVATFKRIPLAAINFTDIHRDGMQTGPNIEQTRRLAQTTPIPVVASGGVSTITDIEGLLPLEADGVVGVIVGQALYRGTLQLREALALANRGRAAG
jgi:phosphoribosylformimino-5-aminoimidazole carboxamide ribotide isomerase